MGLVLKATVATNGSGDATVYVGMPLPGSSGVTWSTAATDLRNLSGAWTVESITYTKTDYADTADFNITENATGITLWAESNVTATKTLYTRAYIGDAATGTVSTTVSDVIKLIDSQIKIVIAQGGASKTGTFTFKLS